MGLTRARVYQLLNEINDIMTVRWPLGRHQVYELREKFQSEARQMDPPPDLNQFPAAVELFYPGSRRGAAGPLEHVGELATRRKKPLRRRMKRAPLRRRPTPPATRKSTSSAASERQGLCRERTPCRSVKQRNAGCHCWLAQQCEPLRCALPPSKPAVAPTSQLLPPITDCARQTIRRVNRSLSRGRLLAGIATTHGKMRWPDEGVLA